MNTIKTDPIFSFTTGDDNNLIGMISFSANNSLQAIDNFCTYKYWIYNGSDSYVCECKEVNPNKMPNEKLKNKSFDM